MLWRGHSETFTPLEVVRQVLEALGRVIVQPDEDRGNHPENLGGDLFKAAVQGYGLNDLLCRLAYIQSVLAAELSRFECILSDAARGQSNLGAPTDFEAIAGDIGCIIRGIMGLVAGFDPLMTADAIARDAATGAVIAGQATADADLLVIAGPGSVPYAG